MARKPQLNTMLRAARLKKGLTLQQLADAIGVTGAAIAHWEAGKNRPREAHLAAACKALKISVRNARELAGL
ncbi:MAG: XRE family transcriptional regulator [Acetobacteraceae bacterium]|nr:XRE family transcriptional regulator [Acetobacteraceae bacterium]